MLPDDVVEMLGRDCLWAAEVMQRRRQQYSLYSPVFWRPVQGAAALHSGFLASQVARDDVVALRTAHAFVIAEVRGPEGFIDDFAVERPEQWQHDGARLLSEAWRDLHARGAAAVRVVSAHKDRPKNFLLGAAGLSVVEEWWVKPVIPTGYADERGTV
jgi:hypothetical protein